MSDIDQAKLFQTISLAVADATKKVLEGEQANRIRELEAANKKLADGPYVITNSPQMLKDYIESGVITDGMVVIIQSKLDKKHERM